MLQLPLTKLCKTVFLLLPPVPENQETTLNNMPCSKEDHRKKGKLNEIDFLLYTWLPQIVSNN